MYRWSSKKYRIVNMVKQGKRKVPRQGKNKPRLQTQGRTKICKVLARMPLRPNKKGKLAMCSGRNDHLNIRILQIMIALIPLTQGPYHRIWDCCARMICWAPNVHSYCRGLNKYPYDGPRFKTSNMPIVSYTSSITPTHICIYSSPCLTWNPLKLPTS